MDCLPFYAYAMFLSWIVSSTITSGNDTDRLGLVAFKDGITQDPRKVMSTWNNSIHFCQWFGVTCNPTNQRVIILSLESQELVGSISPWLGNLTFLTGINLISNNFIGKLPQELGRLSRLQYLNLTYNSLEGEIPLNLSNCLDLRVLDVLSNGLVGNIPHQLGYLSKLTYLALAVNNLTGTIPASLANCSSLIALTLAQNSFHGSIPDDFGRLSRLMFFQVYDNMLSGIIPPSLYNISSIFYFAVAKNQLHGTLPPDVGLTLPNLEFLGGGANSFAGPIPDSLSNASRLQVLDFAENSLTGSMPMNLGSLQGLAYIYFGRNQLGTGQAGDLNFIPSLANCTSLIGLGLDSNNLGGELPESIGNLSTYLSVLTLGGNRIHGSLPNAIENLVNLTTLGLEGNLFSGTIPFGIGKLQKLQRLHFNVNRFSGMIPSSLGNLTELIYLFMEENRFEGSIPASLGNCQKLIVLNISRNNLSGALPKEVLTLSSLSISLAVAHNSLSGPLPLDVGSLQNLGELEISENNFSGNIPGTLANCISLERLKMGGNSFQGIIPESLKALRGIQVMDFSHNNLSGQIPEFLMNFSSLYYLDLSFNDFDGEVPKKGIFMNASSTMVSGNKKLCGGIKELHLPVCSEQVLRTSRSSLSGTGIILIALGVLFCVLLFLLGILYCLRNLRKNNNAAPTTATSSSENWQKGASFLDIFNSTNGFSSDCLIGEGSFGAVYRGVLGDEKTVVAIKVLKLQEQGASKSFIAECDALKNVRHRNLIKIITACSSLDFQGNDFKALIFEFMSNGSLEQWLHPNTDSHGQLKLSLVQRLNITIDVAFALEYLHCSCEETIVHCDLKPSNILLDEDMIAHVGDFGLARFLFDTAKNLPRDQTFGLKGSIGYIPPEYGMGGQVSILGDVYSYGILLLEMFTGRRPTDDMFKEGLCLYDFVTTALPGRILEIVDPLLFSEAQDVFDGNEDDAVESQELPVLTPEKRCPSTGESKAEECLVSVIKIALSCSAPSPKDRISVRDVVNELKYIRDSFMATSK